MLEEDQSFGLQSNWSNESLEEDITVTNACVCELAPPHIMYHSDYHTYNLYLIVIALPLVATFGIITNVMSFLIFTRGQIVMNSIDYYLAALAASDILVDWCGLFVIAVDSARRFSKLLTEMHLLVIPYILPVGYMAQMCSVYFTVFAAVDCYVSIRKPKSAFCQKRFTKSTIYLIVLCSFLYNCITFLDLEIVDCIDYEQGAIQRQEICPTQLRIDPTYMQIYKVYCYALFMAFIPFALLLVLNFLIIYFVYTNDSKPNELVPICQQTNAGFDDEQNAARGEQEQLVECENSDSTITLVMVVVLFLICNSIGFAVNIVETFGSSNANSEPNVDEQIRLMFVVDAGNFLVVLNSSANFLIYAAFSKKFRNVLKKAWKKYIDKVANLISGQSSSSAASTSTTTTTTMNRSTCRSSRTPLCRNRIQLSTNIIALTLRNFINRKAVTKRRQRSLAPVEGTTIANESLMNGLTDDTSSIVSRQDDTCLIIENRNIVTYQACETVPDNNR